MGASVDLSISNLCKQPEFCVVKVATLVASLLASFFLLATAGSIIMKRLSRRPETPIGRLVDSLVLGLCLLDSTYYLPCLLVVLQGPASPLLMLHSGHESGGRATFIYPHCREAVMMLDILWHCYVAHIMYCWIVLKHSVPRLQKNFNPLLITVLGLLLVTLYVLLDNFFWRAYGLAGLAYGAIVVNILVFPACVIFVLRAYFKTVRALKTGAGDDTFVPERYLRIRRKLLIICATMAVTWTLGPLADMVVWAYILINDIQAAPMMFYPVRLITCRVIGIMDALILAGMFDFCCLRNVLPNTTPMIKALSMLPLFRKDEMEVSEPSTRDNSDERSAALLSPIMGEVKARMFVTSWNMCGANSSRLVTKASLPQWIPAQGYDVYVVVVQEAAFAGELCRAIGKHLGGPTAFTLFSSVVGDARLPDGILAVLVWCRVDMVARGGVQIMTYDATAEGVKGGNRPNTGKLGVSLRLFDTTIALIGTNFRADVKGYNRLHQRNEDSKQALREVFSKHKAMNTFDAHLKHHHTLLIGGLNYRLMCVPEDVLDLVAESARQEAVSFTMENGEGREAAVANNNALARMAVHAEVEEEPLWHAINYQRKLFPQQGQDDFNMKDESKPAAAAEVGVCPTGSSTGVKCMPSVPLCGVGPKVSFHRNSWLWVKDQDELLQCQVLEGLLETFQEGPICFPPTYRWRPDRGAYMDYRSIDDLRQAYSIRGRDYAVKRATAPNDCSQESQPSSHRTPSFTDRILFHSLEGKEDRLRLLAYDMCETVYGSDHKPICAAFELTVDMSAVADSTRVLSSLRDSEGQLFMYSVELCNMRFDCEEWSVAQLDRVAMGFPLENEDLLSAEREQSNPLEGWEEGIPESALKQAMETVTVWPWTADPENASRHYFQKVVMVMEGVDSARWANQHVALKFADREGKCLGQGTFELPTVNQGFAVSSHGGLDETKDSHEREEGINLGRSSDSGSSSPVIQEVVLPLSSAGTRRGSVVMEARVTRTPVDQKKRLITSVGL